MPKHCAQTPVATNLGECARRGKVVPCGRLGWSAVPGTARRESMVWPDHRMARPGAEGGDREVRAAHVRRPGAHPSHDGRRPRHDGPQHAALRAELTSSGELLDGAGPAYRADTTTLRLDGGAAATSHGPLITSRVQLTAYYLVRCPDVDRAPALAAHILDSHVTAVKVRPSMTQPTPSSASSSTDPGDRRLAATWAQRRSRREASHGNPVAA